MQDKLLMIFTVLIALMIVSCSPKQSEIIVAEYGNYDIKMDEFEKAYAKNAGSLEKAKKDSIQDLSKFLDLYVNFKMKLRDAQVRKLNDDERIVTELKEYERTIGTSYLLEKELIEKGIKRLYDNRGEELRVSHLLLRTDTISVEKAQKKAQEIIDRVKNGASFEVEVSKYSDDQFSRNKGGDIYYFTAGMIMPEFEDIAYQTPVGEIHDEPLKTKYGFHIIKVTDRIKRVPKIKASHILLRNEPPTDSSGKSKKELIAEILLRARNGEDFAKLAAEYSEDPGSREKGGELGFFSRRQMVQPFDEAAFNLKEGEISDIVETQFGYHIIKLLDIEEYPSFDSEKKTLRELYERTRKQKDYESLINKYSSELNVALHEDVLKEVVSNAVDSVLNESYWESDFHNNFGSSVLFSIDNAKYTTDSLMNFSLKDPQMYGKSISSKKLVELNDKYKDQKIIETKALSLAEYDKEFGRLMKEYKNGILIFRLQEDEVWNKMTMDSTAIHELYEDTKENYSWPDRVQYTELFSKSDSLINHYHNLLIAGDDFDSLMTKFSEKKGRQNSEEWVNAESNSLSKAAFGLENPGDFSKVIKNTNGWSIVKLVKKDPARIKTFDEARAEVTSAYQDLESARLENNYVSRLKNTYKPELFYEELANAYKN